MLKDRFLKTIQYYLPSYSGKSELCDLLVQDCWDEQVDITIKFVARDKLEYLFKKELATMLTKREINGQTKQVSKHKLGH